eukprot:6176094-Pleurochrysis_carterae.AAC.3
MKIASWSMVVFSRSMRVSPGTRQSSKRMMTTSASMDETRGLVAREQGHLKRQSACCGRLSLSSSCPKCACGCASKVWHAGCERVLSEKIIPSAQCLTHTQNAYSLAELAFSPATPGPQAMRVRVHGTLA